MKAGLSFAVLFLLVGMKMSVAMPVDSDASDQLRRKTIVSWNDTVSMRFLFDSTFFRQGWDTMAQVRFWKEVINLSSDTCIINVASCRKPVYRIPRSEWSVQNEQEKSCYKDSLCSAYCLEPGTNLFVTAGKGEFYEVKKTLSYINAAIESFEKADCDPWYAQTILLIESPGKLKTKSSVGASGPFQLMPSVARKYGLRVNKYHDDRSDIHLAAAAAARLLKSTCIPYVRSFLDAHSVSYKESDIWFRLLVLHAYHAGAGNVRCVIDELNPTSGGPDLMRKVWQTTCRGFKNESQNYSQIALASLLNFDELISMDGDTVYLVRGDKLMHEYRVFRKSMRSYEAYEYLQQTLATYEKDFIDDMIPYDEFMNRIGSVREEFVRLATTIKFNDGDFSLKKYPAGEKHITALAGELSRRRRFQDAIRLLQLNLDLHPGSTAITDSLSRVYRLSGDNKSAERYAGKSSLVDPIR